VGRGRREGGQRAGGELGQQAENEKNRRKKDFAFLFL
jgi:hypothetical protein